MGLFDPPSALVLREGDRERVVIACSRITSNGREVVFVRVGAQFRTEGGEWRWTPKAGASIPLRRLGEVARWLVDCARAIPHGETPGGEW